MARINERRLPNQSSVGDAPISAAARRGTSPIPPGYIDQPNFDVRGFLNEPARAASVATVTARGRPALAMMWFLLDDRRFWFHTPQAPDRPAPFLKAAAAGQEVAAMIATFNPPDVRQVRTSGPARLENPDERRTRAIYARYVKAWTPAWEEQVTSAGYRLWSMLPQRGMAVAYPGLENRPAFRWSQPWM